MKPTCSIFFHNYYGEHDFWIDYFDKKIQFPTILYYNIVTDNIYNYEVEKIQILADNRITQNIQKIIFRYSPNKGKDIGGKLILLDSYLHINIETEFGLFFHDKKSPYKVGNESWSQNLFKIAEPNYIQQAMKVFETSPSAGIVTAYGTVKNEWSDATKSFISTNKLLLKSLQTEFNIFPENYQYVAGTIFWSRMKPLTTFFTNYAPLKIREMLEAGNVSDEITGTNTHSWERLLSWIVNMQDFKIKTV